MTNKNVGEAFIAAALEHEQHPGGSIVMAVQLPAMVAVVRHLQLALRHPYNTGPSAVTMRNFLRILICATRDAGFPAIAFLLELGNDPANDGPLDDSAIAAAVREAHGLKTR